MKLHIIRHGETEDNKKRIIQGKKEGELSKKGIMQSEALAECLSNEKIELILTSNLKRAKETAKIISKFHPKAKILTKDELDERDYGIYNGLKASDVDKKHPSVESEKSLSDRAKKISDFLKSCQFQNVAIVAHGSINKRLIKILSNKENTDFLKNGSLSVIEIEEGKNKLVKLNDINHLDKEIILMGGGDYRNNENKKIDEFIINKAGKKANFVFIPFAVREPEKREKRVKSIIDTYYKQGVKNFEILDENKMSREEMKNKIKKANVLFLTGGDPKILLESLDKLELKEEIANSKMLIIGFSAGGMILSEKCIIPEGMDKNYPETIYLEGLGLVKQSFIPHYNEKFDETLKDISKKVDIYAISEGDALYIDLLTGDCEKLGEIKLFSKGKKNPVIIQ